MTKRELSQLFLLNREIEDDRIRLQELESAARGGSAKLTGMPRINGNGRSMENIAVEIAEQRELVENKLKNAMILRNRIERYIVSVDDSLMRQVLFLRYVSGLSWTQVAMHIGGGNTADGVRKAHDRFLQKK